MSTRNLTEILFDSDDGWGHDEEDSVRIKEYMRENFESFSNATTYNAWIATFPGEWDEVCEEVFANAPCATCGRYDLPLHTDYNCPNCYE